jgi:undecaprenyl diphosphate synthase
VLGDPDFVVNGLGSCGRCAFPVLRAHVYRAFFGKAEICRLDEIGATEWTGGRRNDYGYSWICDIGFSRFNSSFLGYEFKWSTQQALVASFMTNPPKNVPRHVAVIMDGNGRWAKQRGLPRIEGHRMGSESVRAIVRACGEIGIEYLTLYAFSSENWNRPRAEVSALMHLLEFYLKQEIPELNKNNVRLAAIGRIHELPASAQKQLAKSIEALSKNTGLTLVLALSYGGRAELVDAMRSIAREVKAGHIDVADIDEKVIAKHLYTGHIPDPDLLVRTSGEMRVSNFLLWQISYAEIYVTDVLWPDFRKPELEKAVENYGKRTRRFGLVNPPENA